MKRALIPVFLFFIGSSPALAWERMIALNPMVAEWSAILLGKETVLKKLVGASEYSRFPEYLSSIPAVGPYPKLQIETIISLKPDLIVGSEEYNQKEQLEKLSRLNLNVITLPKETLSGMPEWILRLGRILHAETSAKEQAQKWKSWLDRLSAPQEKRRVFVQIQLNPLVTIGKSSFLTEAFDRIGYRNIFSDTNTAYPKISKEAVLSRKPESIFVLEMVQNEGERKAVQETWKDVPLTFLNGDDFSRCSPRLLLALEGLKGQRTHE